MTVLALSDFEAKVQQIMASFPGVPREKAEQSVRMNFPHLSPALQRDIAEAANVREKEEQSEIYKLFRGYRFKVRNLSQARASKQAPGLGDAWIVHRDLPLAFWWESKRQVGGGLSAAQVEMRDDCWRCGVRYYCGDRYAAVKLLVELGIAREGQGQYGIVPIDTPRTSSSGR